MICCAMPVISSRVTDGGQGSAFDHQNDLVAVARQGLAERDWQDHSAIDERARHAAGARRLDLPVRDRLEPAANDLRAVGGGVERQRENGAPEGRAEEAPEAEHLQGRAKLPKPIVDEEYLHQQRRAAERRDVAADGPDDGRPPGLERQGEGKREDEARRAPRSPRAASVSGTPCINCDRVSTRKPTSITPT